MRLGVSVGARSLACACACSLINPACNATLYCHLRLLWLHEVFGHSHKWLDFRKKVIENKICVLIFSTCFV